MLSLQLLINLWSCFLLSCVKKIKWKQVLVLREYFLEKKYRLASVLTNIL